MSTSTTPAPPTTTMDELLERIAFLERELIETRLQLACSKSSEEIMRLELTKMSTALARATDGNNSDSRASSPFDGLNNPAATPSDNENVLLSHRNIHETFVVPTANPFPRTNSSKRVHRAGKTLTKVLKPGSCASGINLLALAHHDPVSTNDGSSSSSLMGLQRRQRRTSSRGLNPGSCASGLDLLGLTSLNPSMRSMSSSSRLRANNNGQQQQHLQLLRNSTGASGADNAGGVQRNNISGNNIALLLGNARLLSASSRSSMRRSGSSRINNTQLSRVGNQGGNRNADWDLF